MTLEDESFAAGEGGERRCLFGGSKAYEFDFEWDFRRLQRIDPFARASTALAIDGRKPEAWAEGGTTAMRDALKHQASG